MEPAAEEFSKFLAISGKQSEVEWENQSEAEWEKRRNADLHHPAPPNLLNGSNLFVRPSEQPGDEEAVRKLSSGDKTVYEVLGDSKHPQRLSDTPSYEALDALGHSAHYNGKNDGEGPRCFGGFKDPIENHNGQSKKIDPTFLCLTDDQKASSALCTDLYEEVICPLYPDGNIEIHAFTKSMLPSFGGFFKTNSYLDVIISGT